MQELGTGMTLYKGTRGLGSSGKTEDFDIIHIVNLQKPLRYYE